MQSAMLRSSSVMANPLLGNRMSLRVAPAAAPAGSTATRCVTTMARKKGVRIIVTLECTEARGEGMTPSRYVTQKVRCAIGGWGGARESGGLARMRARAGGVALSSSHTPYRSLIDAGQAAVSCIASELGMLCSRERAECTVPSASTRAAAAAHRTHKQHKTQTTKQNRRNTPERLEIKKFNPNLRRYTLHREIK